MPMIIQLCFSSLEQWDAVTTPTLPFTANTWLDMPNPAVAISQVREPIKRLSTTVQCPLALWLPQALKEVPSTMQISLAPTQMARPNHLSTLIVMLQTDDMVISTVVNVSPVLVFQSPVRSGLFALFWKDWTETGLRILPNFPRPNQNLKNRFSAAGGKFRDWSQLVVHETSSGPAKNGIRLINFFTMCIQHVCHDAQNISSCPSRNLSFECTTTSSTMTRKSGCV